MARNFNRHPDEDELEKYSMADLRDDEAAGFEEHLLNCGPCRQRLAETDAFVSSMQRAAARLRHRQRLIGDNASGPHWN